MKLKCKYFLPLVDEKTVNASQANVCHAGQGVPHRDESTSSPAAVTASLQHVGASQHCLIIVSFIAIRQCFHHSHLVF